MEHLFKTLCSVYDMAFHDGGPPASEADLKFHDEAQLVIVTGTPDRIGFVQSTLAAMREKEHFAGQAAPAKGTPAPETKK